MRHHGAGCEQPLTVRNGDSVAEQSNMEGSQEMTADEVGLPQTEDEWLAFRDRTRRVSRGVTRVRELECAETRDAAMAAMLKAVEDLMNRLAFIAGGEAKRITVQPTGTGFLLSIWTGPGTAEDLNVTWHFGTCMTETAVHLEYFGGRHRLGGVTAAMYGFRWIRMHGIAFVQGCLDRIEEACPPPDGLWDPPLPRSAEGAQIAIAAEADRPSDLEVGGFLTRRPG